MSYLRRQLNLVVDAVEEYRGGNLGLNTLVQRIQGLSDAIDQPDWREDVFPIVLVLEEINAVCLDEHRSLSEAESEFVAKQLDRLQSLTDSYCKKDSDGG